MAAAWFIVCAAIVAAPVLAAHGRGGAAAVFYLFFSGVCHQDPERSFLLCGHALAVCHRCTGIYLGLFLASALARPCPRWPTRNRVLAAGLPLLLDTLLPYAGLWHSTPLSRFATGLLFGTLTAPLLVRGVTEWLQEIPWRRSSIHGPQFKGGLS